MHRTSKWYILVQEFLLKSHVVLIFMSGPCASGICMFKCGLWELLG